MLRLKPREKSNLLGYQALDTQELLALLIRFGTKSADVYALARDVGMLLDSYISGIITHDVFVSKLMTVPGLGNSRRQAILAALEIGKRIFAAKEFIYNSPEKIYNLLEPLRKARQEKVICIMLSTGLQVLAQQELFLGTIDKTIISPREVFIYALKANAKYIVLAHNHPSGNPEPSSNDISQTSRIIEVGKTLDVEVLDHIIVAQSQYVSFRERGLLQ